MFSPPEADEALLRFVVSDDPERVRHLRRWRELVDLDDASTPSHQLLPSAYLRMQAVAPDDPDLGRLRGLYRQRWTSGQQHLAATRRAARALANDGVRFMLPADQLASDAVVEPFVLPLITPRIAVPDREMRSALDVLRDDGWRITGPDVGRSFRRRFLQTDWELESDARRGLRIVLGVDFNPVVRDRTYRKRVWERSTPASEGLGDRRPAPADLLVALLSEAPQEPGALRWAIGSHEIARRETEFRRVHDVLNDPAVGHLLRCLVSRLEFLVQVDPEVESLRSPLEIARAACAAREHGDPPTTGAAERAWAHRSRQARVLVDGLRRHGGLVGTIFNLVRPRR